MDQLFPATRRKTCGSDDGVASHLAVGERPCAWCESVQHRRALLAERWNPVPKPARAPSAEELLELVLPLIAEAVARPRPDRVLR